MQHQPLGLGNVIAGKANFLEGACRLIEFLHVSKAYNTQSVIDDFSLSIADGELVVFVGSSGCGKTTLLKMINKLVSPCAGEIRIRTRDIEHINSTQLRRRMGYVIQQTGLFIHMTVEENIGIILNLQKLDKAVVREKTISLLEMVGLDPSIYLERYPSQLSGGQLQRVGVARAFATDPEIVLMDEPFSALDPITRAQLQDELKQLNTRLKKTIVFVTHDIEEAIRIADRICIINAGHVEQFDTTERILTAPATEYVRKFIGEGRVWKHPQYLTLRHFIEMFSLAETADSEDTVPAFDVDTKIVDILPQIRACAEGAFAVTEGGKVIGRLTGADIIENFFVHMEEGEKA